MKKLSTLAAILLLASCTQRDRQQLNRDYQFTERDYHIEVFSGGDTVFKDAFKGYVNPEDGSDGIYYYKNDTLVEVSGDYVIKSIK